MDTLILNSILGVLLKKVTVPSDFQGRAEVVRLMQEDDVSGLVDSLTDFAVNTACVEFSIETKNPKFTETLKKWLDTINIAYRGQIPVGVKELAREYFKERWKYSSFPVLKIAEWKGINGINVPTKMFFVDGESIHAEDKDNDEENNDLKLLNYDYYLGKDEDHKLEKNVIFAKTNGRWFDKYPVPYLIKRGVYHNWKIIESLKNMQTKILEQVIPYLLLIKKGFQGTTPETSKVYSDPELKQVIGDLQTLVTEIKTAKAGDKNIKAPVRATNFDETIEQLIPDLKTIMDTVLFAQAERNILSGLGFIDVIQGISDTRRESILNPKIFVQEVKTGIEDFKQILNQLVYLIIEKNKKGHRKYINSEFYITASPICIFQTDKFKGHMRMLWERGQLSNQTYCEIVGETEYRTEIHRREKEAKEGLDYTMYPHVKDNREGQGIDIPGEEPVDVDKNGNPIPTDKLDDRDKYNMGMTLEEAFTPEVTENYIRLRQRDPAGFQKKSFRTITLSKPKGIKAVIGRLKGQTTTTVQSYLFDKKKWTIKSAQAWVREHSEESDLETAPYIKITDLPANVKKKLSPAKQRSWMKIFNNAYKFYMKKFKDTKKAETLAFRTAWSQIRQVKAKKKNIKKKIIKNNKEK